MTRRPLAALALACAAVLVTGGATRLSSAEFTAGMATGGNTVTVDRLSNHFRVTPGSAVQPGTSTPVATGNVDSLTLAFGLVPSARTFTDVFTVENVSGTTKTATLTVQGIGQISSATFASSGTSSATLAPGASTTVSVSTSANLGGTGSGSVRLGLSSDTWLYRSYGATVQEAPETPGSVSATPRAAGRIALTWTASSTGGIAGYDVYRSASGGPWTKTNSVTVSGTSYDDTATTGGVSYRYRLRAVLGALESVDSTIATAIADTTAPAAPIAVALANGGGAGNAYVNLANRASVSVAVTLPSTSVATDTVTVTLSNGAASISATAPATAGAGTATVTGLNATSLGDGTITFAASVADAAGNVSPTKAGTAPKDTVAPGAPTATYSDQTNSADRITGTAEANATVSATQTAPSASGPYTGTAAAGGSFTLTVATVNGRANALITVTYLVAVTDAAGNTGASTTVTLTDSH